MRTCIVVLIVGLLGGCRGDHVKERRSALKPDYPPAAYQQALAYEVGRQAPLNFQPSFVVVHVAEGYYAGTISWFKDPASGVSAHYVVSKGGAVTQMVEEKDTAYHVGAALSVTSIGIEHEGFVAEPAKWFTDTLYAGGAALVKNIAERWGLPMDRCHILGHDEVPDPKNPCVYGGAEHHDDPGKGWDWTKFMGLMGGSAAKCSYSCTSKKGSLVGVVRSGSLLPTAPPVVGATVSITGQTATTDKNGFYRFDNLDVGYYFSITVSAAGYKTTSQSQAVVMPLDNYANFALTPGSSPDRGVPSREAGAAQRDLALPPLLDQRVAIDRGGEVVDAAAVADAEPNPPAPGGGCSVGRHGSTASGAAPLLLGLALMLLLAFLRGATRP